MTTTTDTTTALRRYRRLLAEARRCHRAMDTYAALELEGTTLSADILLASAETRWARACRLADRALAKAMAGAPGRPPLAHRLEDRAHAAEKAGDWETADRALHLADRRWAQMDGWVVVTEANAADLLRPGRLVRSQDFRGRADIRRRPSAYRVEGRILECEDETVVAIHPLSEIWDGLPVDSFSVVPRITPRPGFMAQDWPTRLQVLREEGGRS